MLHTWTTRKEDKLNYNGDIVKEAKGQPMEVEEHFDFKVDGSVLIVVAIPEIVELNLLMLILEMS